MAEPQPVVAQIDESDRMTVSGVGALRLVQEIASARRIGVSIWLACFLTGTNTRAPKHASVPHPRICSKSGGEMRLDLDAHCSANIDGLGAKKFRVANRDNRNLTLARTTISPLTLKVIWNSQAFIGQELLEISDRPRKAISELNPRNPT